MYIFLLFYKIEFTSWFECFYLGVCYPKEIYSFPTTKIVSQVLETLVFTFCVSFFSLGNFRSKTFVGCVVILVFPVFRWFCSFFLIECFWTYFTFNQAYNGTNHVKGNLFTIDFLRIKFLNFFWRNWLLHDWSMES